MRVAFIRASESRRPQHERVCFDPLAEQFLDARMLFVLRNKLLLSFLRWRGNRLYPGLRDYIAARTRYIDDCLTGCLQDGLKQLVILGAGFDSRAYRFSGLKERVKVFEVDHPATQQVKRARLNEILPEPVEHVAYIATNFDTEDMGGKLRKNGYSETAKTLFVWEGVTYYLSADAVDATLAFMASHSAEGSSVVFDYLPPWFVKGSTDLILARSLLNTLKRHGEAMDFGIDRSAIQQFLEVKGFSLIENVGTEYFRKEYFSGVNQNRAAADAFSIVRARVIG